MTECPNCGSKNIERDEVDVGVGTVTGPWGCFDCGWYEGAPDQATFDVPPIESEDQQ